MLFKSICKPAVLAIGCLFLTACNEQKAIVHIAAKPMVEQFIMAEMLGLLIEQNSDLKVDIKKGIGGGTANIHPAMLKGEFDLYPEYTGTAWLYVLKKAPLTDDKALFDELQQDYAKLGLQWVGLYGFNNTFGLAVRTELAEKNQLQTFAELAAISPQLDFGAEYDFFEREDGYKGLQKTYGFAFNQVRDLDIGLKYQALLQNQVAAINVFTTDGQLADPQIKLLEDDKHFYPSYYAGTVIRTETLQQHPELKAILQQLDGKISNREMAEMNAAVEIEGKDEKTVAKAFLQRKGLLK
ncbi:glycine betaine ABC transporter substrate-binding protein [Pasteurellaceae bacterium LIM206]|nr:glycine betaine ABC transporter substrate-binding protein [Pasteurellaceae bacterium LIM206]